MYIKLKWLTKLRLHDMEDNNADFAQIITVATRKREPLDYTPLLFLIVTSLIAVAVHKALRPLTFHRILKEPQLKPLSRGLWL